MDVAHKETDAIIEKVEKKVKREYAQAQKEIEKKANAYFIAFAEKDKKKLELVRAGQMSQEAYAKWRTQQLLVGKRWQDMSASLSKDLSNARNISASIVKGYMPEVYATNFNFSTFEIEAGTGIDTSFTLYDRQTVERLLRDNPQMLPDPSEAIKDKIKQKKIERWSRQKMTSAVTQAILQGESIDKLAKRLRSVTSMDAASSIRNARTMMTNAQSAGRYDGYRRAKEMGVQFKVMWIATLDDRTRHEHRMLDGQMQEVDEPFVVDGVEIMYPADYGGKDYKVPPDMIYNCRCTIGAAVKGTKLYDEGIGAANRVVGTGQTYEEWKNAKAKQPKPQKTPNIPRNVNGDLIEFNLPPAKNDRLQRMRDYQVEVLKDLSDEYNTRLQKVTIGAENAAGDVDISCSRLRLSSTKIEVAVHEFAHTLANTTADKYGLTNDKDFWDEIRKIRTSYRKAVRNDYSKSISFYADGEGKLDEFFAEAFTQAKMTELGIKLPENQYGKDTEYSEKVLAIIDKYFKKRGR